MLIILMWDLSWSEVSRKVTLEGRPERGGGINKTSRENRTDEIAGTTIGKGLEMGESISVWENRKKAASMAVAQRNGISGWRGGQGPDYAGLHRATVRSEDFIWRVSKAIGRFYSRISDRICFTCKMRLWRIRGGEETHPETEWGRENLWEILEVFEISYSCPNI